MPEKPIELRKIIGPNDPVFDYISKIKEFLGTASKSLILDFILSRISMIPFEELIHMKTNQETVEIED